MAAYRVLVVEDNHEVRRMVSASIKTLEAEIDVLDVPSAEEALFISTSLPLDLVILDFRLPGMTGIDMVSRLRKRRPETKVILVTGVEDATVRQQVAEASAEAYFYKPIEIDKFLDAVKRCLWGDQAKLPPAAAIPEPAEAAPATRPLDSSLPHPSDAGLTLPQRFMPTLDERLTTLKQQLRAVSVLLMSDAGQVLEVAGNPSQITSGSALLSGLMRAFHASVHVSRILGRGTSMQYFTSQRQCLYMAPVGLSHALFAITSGFFEPDKLAIVDRYLQMAVHDLQDILANISAEERARQDDLEKFRAELPAQVHVDPETRQRVEDMFTQGVKTTDQQGADSFWDTTGDDVSLDRPHSKDILTYDQAHDLGLTPGEDKPT
jgi:DNA-binding response OmpR family regulator